MDSDVAAFCWCAAALALALVSYWLDRRSRRKTDVNITIPLDVSRGKKCANCFGATPAGQPSLRLKVAKTNIPFITADEDLCLKCGEQLGRQLMGALRESSASLEVLKLDGPRAGSWGEYMGTRVFTGAHHVMAMLVDTTNEWAKDGTRFLLCDHGQPVSIILTNTERPGALVVTRDVEPGAFSFKGGGS